jgi:hypothetical protein
LGGNLRKSTIDGGQQLFALVLPLKFGDASLLGDIFQLALGHLELRLEAEGVELPVGRGRVVVRLRIRNRGKIWKES